MKVLFLTNVPSPYRVDFFNELGKVCELTVLFEKSTSDERDDSWKKYQFENFEGILLKVKRISVDNAVCFGVVRYLKKGKYDHIIFADFLYPTGMIAIEYMRARHIPYWLECDGGFAKDGKGFKERVKKHFISGAQGYFSPCAAADEYLCTYGAKAERLRRYPFTSLKESDMPKTVLDHQKKSELKGELGLTEQFTVLTVGRFSYLKGYGKGYDVLMKVAEQLRNVQFCIVGDEPTQEFAEWKKQKQLDNVVFVGFKDKNSLSKYYMASDLFVLMTVADVWGLVINEAMMFGLPVITTEKCGAGTELVQNDDNGYLIPVGATQLLKEKIEWLIAHPDAVENYGKRSYQKIQGYTIKDMVEAHMKVLGEVTNEGLD